LKNTSSLKKVLIIALICLISGCGGDSRTSKNDKDIASVTLPVDYDIMKSNANITLDSESSSFVGLTYIGQDIRTMYDERIKENIRPNP